MTALILFAALPASSLSGSDSALTLEYVPMAGMSLSGGFGLGLGYERGMGPRASWRMQASGGMVPAGKGGADRRGRFFRRAPILPFRG